GRSRLSHYGARRQALANPLRNSHTNVTLRPGIEALHYGPNAYWQRTLRQTFTCGLGGNSACPHPASPHRPIRSTTTRSSGERSRERASSYASASPTSIQPSSLTSSSV